MKRKTLLMMLMLLGLIITLPSITAQDNVTDPFELVSQESLFYYLEDLTSIQAYSGWRNSATEGESEAMDYVAETLGDFTYLQGLGMEFERQSFHVFLSTEIWVSQLYLTIDGQEIEVPANAIRGHRTNVTQAMRFDSDGVINDADNNPVTVQGEIIFIRSSSELRSLDEDSVRGKIIVLDYEIVNPSVHGLGMPQQIMNDLVDKNPAGLLLITQFSGSSEKDDGYLIGDGHILRDVTSDFVVPVLYARLEDMTPAGINNWEDLAKVEEAHLIWDTDVFSPGTSGNLIVRIPGVDPSRAIILGAHIDSPNSPGAMDNGSGSVVLLEVARVLNDAQIQPDVDVYLVWFGSEEIGLVGSQYFVSTHQELLDQTLAVMGVDCLTNPPGYIPSVVVDTWSYSRFGDPQLLLPNRLARTVSTHNVSAQPVDFPFAASDNAVFTGFVPQVGLFYSVEADVPGRIHNPYDTVEIAREVGDGLEQMAIVALSFVLDVEQYATDLNITPVPDRRALIVASHTETPNMTPTMLIEFGMALSWEGFDVDMIPYGQVVAASDLEDADLVIVLPVYDYSSPETDTSYDEAWTEGEIEALVDYVDAGGFMVLTNSASNFRYGMTFGPNEDWIDMNDLSGHFGIIYQEGELPYAEIWTQQHELMSNRTLTTIEGNGVPFSMETGLVLAESGSEPAIVLIDYGDSGGQALVLADLGIFADSENNLQFWRNLAQYAR